MARISDCTYLLPFRRREFAQGEALELHNYFAGIRDLGCEVLVIDGSPDDVRREHQSVWVGCCRHEPVDSRFRFLNDKVNGILTGVCLAANEFIVLADDDIRYTAANLERIRQLLNEFEVVRPQNYLAGPMRWWAKTESARMLINRAMLRRADYPGTCAFRKSTFLRAGEYDGDVLFDNEELLRHLARAQANICYAPDLFIAKKPPRFRKWLEQRPRQAYEDFGLRAKTVFFAAFLPALVALGMIDPRWWMIVLLSIPVAAVGWWRGNARNYFRFSDCVFAPFWTVERALSTYWAFFWFVTRGGYPFGDRLLSKGIGRDWVEGGRVAARQ